MGKSKAPYQLYEVHWHDAVSCGDEKDVGDVLYPPHQITIGYLIRDKEFENFITMAAEYDHDEPKSVRDRCTIPKGMIIKMVRKKK